MKSLIIVTGAVLLAVGMFAAKKKEVKNEFNIKEFEKSLRYIPTGSFIFNDSNPDYNADMKDDTSKHGKTEFVQGFYMCNHTVTNGEYLQFVTDLQESGNKLYYKMLPDTEVWRNKEAYNEPYVKYYLRHPAFQNYPVVGVSHEQAEYYCKWLTVRYAKESKRKYKNAVFKLPSVYQYDYAAMGGLVFSPYPWGGPHTRGVKGQQMANFRSVDDGAIKLEIVYLKDSNDTYRETKLPAAIFGGNNIMGSNGYLCDAADITSPVFSYYPNKYGLYNMAGNVSEYLSEKGITKGGSWKDYGYYLQNWVEQPYDTVKEKASDDRGFRIIMVTTN